MRFKKPKNKKTKVHIKFDAEDRKTYLLGFRKRKLERKEKAKKEIVEKYKKEKCEVKKKRKELIQKMIENRNTEMDSDEENANECGTEPSETPVVTQCGDCTVEVSGLNLQSETHLGVNKSQTSKEGLQSEKLPFKLSASGISNRTLKTSIWKSATKDAKKIFNSEKMSMKFKKKKRKKKIMVTEL